ncbi:MAG: apolipoprotein N-acyltransferase [Planctomycetia bacterium]
MPASACRPSGTDGFAAAAAAVAAAVLVAAPWLRQELAVTAVAGVASALLLVPAIRGWAGEVACLLAATLTVAIAFHWLPVTLAGVMETSRAIGFAFAVPIVAWDALRLAVPLWCAARLVRDPRDAWLPAALAAVVAEVALPSVFPWKIGSTMAAWPLTVQAVDLFGAEWSTFVLFAHAGLLVALVVTADLWLRRRQDPAAARQGRTWTPAAIAAAGIVGANAAYGWGAMSAWTAAIESAPRLRVAVVQADPAADEPLLGLQRLTRAACAADACDLVCWPECSGGSYASCLETFADADLLRRHSRPPWRGVRPLDEGTCPLLFGGQVYEGLPEKPRALFQAAILMEPSGAVAGVCHKRHLMPFGEYVPWAAQFPELRLSFPRAENYSTGSEATVLVAGPARIGPLLCYEDMLPTAAATLVRNSANLLVSLVNGASFTAPVTLSQHRLLAQLRAVENRRSLVRCAATGETCVVSPLGVVVARLPLHAEDVLVADVPLVETLTPATRAAGAFPLACGAGLAVLVLRRWRAARGGSTT